MTPLEETMHILLREHTERAIREGIKQRSVTSIKKVRRLANDWIAVEEAIVGGVVKAVLPSILENYIDGRGYINLSP